MYLNKLGDVIKIAHIHTRYTMHNVCTSQSVVDHLLTKWYQTGSYTVGLYSSEMQHFAPRHLWITGCRTVCDN